MKRMHPCAEEAAQAASDAAPAAARRIRNIERRIQELELRRCQIDAELEQLGRELAECLEPSRGVQAESAQPEITVVTAASLPASPEVADPVVDVQDATTTAELAVVDVDDATATGQLAASWQPAQPLDTLSETPAASVEETTQSSEETLQGPTASGTQDTVPHLDVQDEPEEPLVAMLQGSQGTLCERRKLVVSQILQQDRCLTTGLCGKELWEQIPPTVQDLLFDVNYQNMSYFLRHQIQRQTGDAWLRQASKRCRCSSCSNRAGGHCHKYSLLSVFPRAWALFSEQENETVVNAWRGLDVADPSLVKKLGCLMGSHILTLTLAASRQILLRIKDIEARSATRVQLNRVQTSTTSWDPDDVHNPTPTVQVLARFPLHAGSDSMVVALLTLQWFAVEETVEATHKWEQRLGGSVCTSFLLQQMYSARAQKKDEYQALQLFKILKVEAVIGGLYGQGASKRRRRD